MVELTSELQQKEKTAQLLWTGFILTFFIIQAIIWAFAITFTANDKSHAVVAGYDEKALNWDEQVALRYASERLGWQTELWVDPAADILGVHELLITLTDSAGGPVTRVSWELTAFHRGRAGDPQHLQLVELKDGVYSGKIVIRKSGSWRIQGRAQKGDEVLLIEETLSLNASR